MSPQRTLWSDLRAIDRAIVPRLAAFAELVRRAAHEAPRAIVPRLAVVAGSSRRAAHEVWRTVRRGGGARELTQRLDRRYARRGALALVRDVPQLGAAVLTVLLVVSALTVAARTGNSSTRAGGSLDLPAVNGPAGLTVGPIAGSVADYLAGARADLLARAQQAPRDQAYGIADFEKGLHPSEAAAAVPGVAVKQVFLRVPAGGPPQFFPSTGVDFAAVVLKAPLTVTGLPDGAQQVFDRVADALVTQAALNEQFAGSIPADAVQQDLEQKASQLADAHRFRAAAAELRAGCACIYAAVVQGQAQTLADIANSGKVRVVQAALSGVPYNRLTWVPLSPDLKDGDQYHPAGS